MCWLGAASLAGCRQWVCVHCSCAGVSQHRGLRLWAGEQRRHRILSSPSNLDNDIFIFSDQFYLWQTFLVMGVVPVFILRTLVQWKASFGLLTGAHGHLVCSWLVCCGVFFCASSDFGFWDTFV